MKKVHERNKRLATKEKKKIIDKNEFDKLSIKEKRKAS